ncbi:MAG: ABC transporter ATP-binding protein [Thermodesulfovibrionales bacterium]
MPLLEVRNLSVSFKAPSGHVNIVNDLSFEVEEGSVFGLAGESGCGKSLTALAIMGILPPNLRPSGAISYRGRDLLTLGPEELRDLRGREISMIFQEPMTSLNPVLRVGHQIAEVITTHLKVPKKEALRRTADLLRAVRIPSPEARMKEYPHQMSGGMRQRIMIAAAIACGPALLIADEPTTALDVTIEAQILELLRTLSAEKDMAVLLITHDLGVIAENAGRVGIMYAGRMVETASVGDLFRRPMHPYTMGLMASLPTERGKPLKPIAGSVPRPGELPPGCRFSDRCPYAVEACRREEPALRAIEARGSEGRHLARCIRVEEIIS